MEWSLAPSSTGTGVLVLILVSMYLLIWPWRATIAASRLAALSVRTPDSTVAAPGPGPGGGSPFPDGVGGAGRAALFAGLAGTACLLSFPSLLGGAAAASLSAGSYLLIRGSSRASEDATGTALGTRLRHWAHQARGGADADPTLPFAVDLLAVCLRAGMPTSAALRAVSGTLSEHSPFSATARAPRRAGTAAVLGRVAASCELGSEPGRAWDEWIGHPQYGALARALVVTGESGSAVAGRLEAVSAQLRSCVAAQAMTRAQRAGVALMAPLGMCFLPAFVCLGVVPVVVGIAGRVFG